jgi:NhaC family Na+:H+ antiporter
MTTPIKLPSFSHALLTFGSIVCVIGYGLFGLNTSLHALMLICLAIASFSAWYLQRGSFDQIREAMNVGVGRAHSAIYILILIGVLIAAFIQSGTVGAMVYYGMQYIGPAIFLPAGLILCSLMSLATGTSWGTAGTVGVVLMGIGDAMGIPLPLIAGMVVSGACFGDKMSPVSDSVVLASMSANVNVYAHIRSMMYTTVPTYIITLIAFSVIGMGYADKQLPAESLAALSASIKSLYTINVLCLLPFFVLIGLSLKRVSAEVAMMSAVAVAVLLAVFMQGANFTAVLGSLYDGVKVSSGSKAVDTMLNRGGITSMMWTLSIAIMALALGGILDAFGFLRVLISAILSRAKSAFALVTTTSISMVVGNMTMGEAYMSIILGGQLFSKPFDDQGIDRVVLSRTLEEGATLTTPLIPWTTGGAFFAATLGVSPLAFAPWALLNWINILMGIAFAFFGLAIFRTKSAQTAQTAQSAQTPQTAAA